MSEIKQVKKLIVLKDGVHRFKEILSSKVPLEDDAQSKIRKITTSGKLDEEGKTHEIKKDGEIVLSRKLHQQVVQTYLNQSAAKTPPSDDTKDSEHLLEETSTYRGFTEYEQDVQKTMENTSDIGKRIHHRRNGALSWLLAGYLNTQGLSKNDDFEPVEKSLKGDQSFTQKVAKFLNKEEVEFDSKSQGVLAKCVSRMQKICNVLPEWFVSHFAKAFVFLNVLSPWIAKWGKGTTLGSTFSVIKMINPWIDEFVNNHTALSGDKIIDNKRILAKPHNNEAQKLDVSEVDYTDTSKTKNKEVIGDVELFKLDDSGNEFRKVRDITSSAVSRLVAPRTASGMIFNWIMKMKGFANWNEFSKKYVEVPHIAEGVYGYLDGIKGQKKQQSIGTILEGVSKQFKTQADKGVAKGFVALLAIVNSLPNWFIEKVPKYFGAFWSGAYLVLPTLNNIIGEESRFGKAVGLVQRFAPIINDVIVDPFASVFQEANYVKKTMGKHKDLFKNMPTGSSVISDSVDFLKNMPSKFKSKSKTKGKPATGGAS